MSRLTLALDVMGGDIGPRVTIPASILALEADPMLSLILFGDRQQIDPLIKSLNPNLKNRLILEHCDRQIINEQEMAAAIRQSKNTSMRLAIEAVQKGIARGCVSAGNTAVLMGLSKIILRPLENIIRPALVSMIPNINGGKSVMLDLGANIDCSEKELCQFAQMGAIFAENCLDLVYPRIALLNIGSEEVKGYKYIRDAGQLLAKDYRLNYVGFIEGNDLLNNKADVIVTDGFAGNIALKTLEGAAKNMITLFKGNQYSTHRSHLFSMIVRHLIKHLFKKGYNQLAKMNPDQYNGASLLGLTSVVVKSHGSANIAAFAYAIQDAAFQARQQIPEKILAGLSNNLSNSDK